MIIFSYWCGSGLDSGWPQRYDGAAANWHIKWGLIYKLLMRVFSRLPCIHICWVCLFKCGVYTQRPLPPNFLAIKLIVWESKHNWIITPQQCNLSLTGRGRQLDGSFWRIKEPGRPFFCKKKEKKRKNLVEARSRNCRHFFEGQIMQGNWGWNAAEVGLIGEITRVVHVLEPF